MPKGVEMSNQPTKPSSSGQSAPPLYVANRYVAQQVSREMAQLYTMVGHTAEQRQKNQPTVPGR